MSLSWTQLPVPTVLFLVLVLSRSVSAARSDRNMMSEEYVGVTVNATVLDGRGNTIHVMSSDDGTYGQNSPKVDTRGIVIAPAPHHGGTDITAHLKSQHTGFNFVKDSAGTSRLSQSVSCQDARPSSVHVLTTFSYLHFVSH